MSAPTAGQGKKLVFVGDSGVGKTCIIARFTRGSFDPNSPSGSAGFSNKTIEIPELNRSLALDIWDTVGQERFRALTKYFYQGAKMAILVYDITRKATFDSIKGEWYEQLKDYGDSDVIIGIAGNKSDLYDEEAVSEQEAREFAKSIGAVFSLTSAQSNTGINELFQDLAKKFLNPNSPNQPDSRKVPENNDNIVIGKPKNDEKPKPKFC